MSALLPLPLCSSSASPSSRRHSLHTLTTSSLTQPPHPPPLHRKRLHVPLHLPSLLLHSPPSSVSRRQHNSPNAHSNHFRITSGSNNNSNADGSDGGGGGGDRWRWGGGGWRHPHPHHLLLRLLESRRRREATIAAASLASAIGCAGLALARSTQEPPWSAWVVKGGEWIRLAPDPSGDGFLVDGRRPAGGLDLRLSMPSGGAESLWRRCRDVWVRLMLPEGYPGSVTGDYLEYSMWRGLQGIASQINGVLSTQALLYAIGLGKGAIPQAAAVNWVLKDGLGYLSKILLSNFGRHFDVHPKGWRLFSDLLENASYGLEILTPAFPHLFVPIGAVAGASRSASALIQAATRSCFFAGFAAQRNFAEVIAKGEAQGMVSKFIGIALGIALSNYVRSSSSLALASFGIVTGIQLYCNLKSYQSIQLRTLNPYRASLLFSEYLLSGQVPSVKEVNDEEPFFPDLPVDTGKSSYIDGFQTLSWEAKDAAVQIGRRLQLGGRLSEVVSSKEDAWALFDLYKDEEYMLAEKNRRYHVILKDGASPEDMLKSVFHANYLYWLETNMGWVQPGSVSDECQAGGKLQLSLDYTQREFAHVKNDGLESGWVMDGLIARSLPYRISPGYREMPAR